MKKLRIYTDTSVIGGCHDEEFSTESRRFFNFVHTGRLKLLLSDLVIAELHEAPEAVRQVIASVPRASVENVAINIEVIALRDAYVAAGIVGVRWLNDAAHVAAATVAGADAIVSWNFKHIVRLEKMKAYNKVNRIRGYGELTIITPREVFGHDSEDKEKNI